MSRNCPRPRPLTRLLSVTVSSWARCCVWLVCILMGQCLGGLSNFMHVIPVCVHSTHWILQIFNPWRFLTSLSLPRGFRLSFLVYGDWWYFLWPQTPFPRTLPPYCLLYCFFDFYTVSLAHIFGLTSELIASHVSKKFGAWYDSSTGKDTCLQAW